MVVMGREIASMSARDVRLGMRVYYHGKPATIWSAGPSAGSWWLVIEGETGYTEAKTSELLSERDWHMRESRRERGAVDVDALMGVLALVSGLVLFVALPLLIFVLGTRQQ